jgi:starch-binding outer membrane protein SusE/F
MKTINKYILFAAGLLTFGLISCEDEQEIDLTVGTVSKLYTPTNNEAITLSADESATFEWEPTRAEDAGVVLYDVLFDKVGGDFSSPAYVVSSDGSGLESKATITHKVLDKIANAAGISQASTGSFIWAIRSSKGLKGNISTAVDTMTVTRLQGFSTIPGALYMSGTGTEAETGNKLTFCKARDYKDALEDGVFEIFTRLKEGPVYITDSNDKTYCINMNNKTLRDSSNVTNIPSSMNNKVYRIRLDFTACTAEFVEITNIIYQQVDGTESETPAVYQGNGTWLLSDVPLADADNRYKFAVETDDTDLLSYFCATWESNGSEPTSYTSGTHQYIRQLGDLDTPNVYEAGREWDEYCSTYKFMSTDKGGTADMTIIMNNSVDHYTHTLTIK